jgi:nucleoside-diphosphate-sugar epimerase
MNIAVLGATSQIAKDLVLSFAAQGHHELTLVARRPEVVRQWLARFGVSGRYVVRDFDSFGADQPFDALFNFVGVGNPAQAAAMGASIFDVTLTYDDLALAYIRRHPSCRYVFLSSGAAYGASFDQPAEAGTGAVVNINSLQPQDWYGAAKLHAECRHRALAQLPIVDVRVFNYFSHTQDISARFLITDILRAIRDDTVLKTSSDYIVRDFLHPSDFFSLVNALLESPVANAVVDCYSKAPVDKPTLLAAMQREYGLRYEVMQAGAGINATGSKPHYYSRNRRAADFGYEPAFTSLEGILRESERSLSRHPDE